MGDGIINQGLIDEFYRLWPDLKGPAIWLGIDVILLITGYVCSKLQPKDESQQPDYPGELEAYLERIPREGDTIDRQVVEGMMTSVQNALRNDVPKYKIIAALDNYLQRMDAYTE